MFGGYPVGQFGAFIALQQAVGNRAMSRAVTQRCAGHACEGDVEDTPSVQRQPEKSPPASLDEHRATAKAFVKKYYHWPAWDISGMANGLVAELNKPTKNYTFVRAAIHEIPSEFEDNVTADLVNRLPIPISVIGLTSEGRAMLDVIYEAMITGDVSKFERTQATKILEYRMNRTPQAEFVEGLQSRPIFPIRNIGVTRMATATFRAGLLPNGKVKIRYTSIKVVQYDMFKNDLNTLPGYARNGWSQLRDGIELDPNQIVAVRNWDGDPTTPIDIPALGLIDYSNQIEEKTLSTASTAFFLGLTLGAGALGGGMISGLRARVAAGQASKAYLWGARALIWADRVPWGVRRVR